VNEPVVVAVHGLGANADAHVDALPEDRVADLLPRERLLASE
jgi:hypothetical protein